MQIKSLVMGTLWSFLPIWQWTLRKIEKQWRQPLKRLIRTKYLDVGIRFPEQIRLYPEHPIEMWSGLPTYQCKLDRPVNLFPFQPKKRPINKFNKGMFCLLNFQFFYKMWKQLFIHISSLVRSRSRSGDSVSAMSGISSASGGSTLGPLPEDRIAAAGSTTVTGKSAPSDQSPAEIRKQARMSPLMSPRSPGSRPQNTKTRRVSAPPIPDICQLSPPNVQFTLGGTPPTTTHGFGHRRRTSSSSSCGTPPPPGQWQISPNSPQVGPASLGTRTVPTMASPIRRSNSTIPSSAGNIPALSPIQGSPNKSGMSEGQPQGAVGGGIYVCLQSPIYFS